MQTGPCPAFAELRKTKLSETRSLQSVGETSSLQSVGANRRVGVPVCGDQPCCSSHLRPGQEQPRGWWGGKQGPASPSTSTRVCAYLLSARSVLLPTSMMITSLPLSVLTSSIHLEVCWKELRSGGRKRGQGGNEGPGGVRRLAQVLPCDPGAPPALLSRPRERSQRTSTAHNFCTEQRL